MEAYQMTCRSCGKTRRWVGYKTGIGKSPAQLEQMRREQTECAFCHSTDVAFGTDRESEIGQEFAEMDRFAARTIAEILFGTSQTK